MGEEWWRGLAGRFIFVWGQSARVGGMGEEWWGGLAGRFIFVGGVADGLSL